VACGRSLALNRRHKLAGACLAPPAAPWRCVPSSSRDSLRNPPGCVRRGPHFTLVLSASQIVPGSAGSTCAGELAVERRRLRQTRRRPSACGSSRPFARRSAVQISPAAGSTGIVPVNRPVLAQFCIKVPILFKIRRPVLPP
jgi:hypothetical protein